MNQLLSEENIEKQKSQVFGAHPDVNLTGACKLGDGIIRHNISEKKFFQHIYIKDNCVSTLFIPASGSGSRMFKFLYDFLENPTEDDQSNVERFINKLSEFAFFELMPLDLKKKVESFDYNIDELIRYIVEEEGLKLGNLPKGLIPFHRNGRFILNAFQEQLLQGVRFKEETINFHFTINENFKTQFKSSLESIETLTGQRYSVAYSVQDANTNALAFDEDRELVKDENNEVLTRPAGHGALIENLNAIDSELIFIKNIDNVQHESVSEISVQNQQYLAGLLLQFKNELRELKDVKEKRKALSALNAEFQFLKKETDFSELSETQINNILNRPSRVCGMVRNEGQPGGGPFWVNDDGVISKQIVEKAQILKTGDQYMKMVQSQYFNPVMMVVSPTDLNSNKFDLTTFVDDQKYFVVDKTYKGKNIKFRENPGLWNGGMANYNTIFVEIPTSTFSPVKTALDLLNSAHKGI